MANRDDVVKFYGIEKTIKLMREIEPETLKNFRKDIRRITNPAVVAIKTGSPTSAPLSGMRHNGRSGYSPPQVSTTITPFQKSRALGSTTANLVTIKAQGSGKQYGFEISDMAGRANQPGKYPRSRKYIRNGKEMTHRLNGQGEAFIRNLPYSASRWVYRNIEKKLPQIRQEVAASVYKTLEDFNRRINK